MGAIKDRQSLLSKLADLDKRLAGLQEKKGADRLSATIPLAEAIRLLEPSWPNIAGDKKRQLLIMIEAAFLLHKDAAKQVTVEFACSLVPNPITITARVVGGVHSTLADIHLSQ